MRSVRFLDEQGSDFPEWEQKSFNDVLEPVPTKSFQILSKNMKSAGKFDVVDQGKSHVAGYSDQEDKVFSDVPVIVYGDHTTTVKFRKDEFIVGADGTKVLKAKEDDSPEFLFHTLCYYNVKPEGYKRHYSILRSIFLPVPSLPEQEKIAEFFSTLDERIELVDNKVRLLREQKKGYLQRVFNRELVFTDDNGDTFPEWEQKKLGEIISKGKAGGTPTANNKSYYSGQRAVIPFLGISDMTAQGKNLTETSKQITEEALESSSAWLVPAGYLTYAMYASVGKVGITTKPMAMSQALFAMTFGKELSTEYVYSYLEHFKDNGLKVLITTGTQGNINAATLKGISIPVPSLLEQEKIAEFFSALDEQIELTENKLVLLKEQKKGYLQGIFG